MFSATGSAAGARRRLIWLVVGVALLSVVLVASSALASHNLRWVTKSWSGTAHGTLWEQAGYDYNHPDQVHYRGRAYAFGDGRTFSTIRIYNLAAVSCNNGASWPWYSTSPIVTFNNAITSYTNTGYVYVPSCSSFPKYWVRVCGWFTRSGVTVLKDLNTYDEQVGASHNAC